VEEGETVMSSINVANGPDRVAVVQGVGYRWAYGLLAFALLVDVAFRSFFRGEAAWDLLAAVVLTGLFNAAYQGRHGVLPHGWFWRSSLIACLAALVAALLALIL
jgi:hypothetical protein